MAIWHICNKSNWPWITTVFGWPLDLTIIVSGLLETLYTVMGGS